MVLADNTELKRGRALCVVLFWKPTMENIQRAKQLVETTPFDVCYTVQHGGQLNPFVMGKDVIEILPHIYRTYKEDDEYDAASVQSLEVTKEEECDKQFKMKDK